jgi:DNA-binding MarR family transcriptional regulator
MHHQKIYLKFLSLIQTTESKGELAALDSDAKRLLEIIAVRHFLGQQTTISDAMGLKSIASPATLHRKIDALRGLSLLETYFEGKNKRTKYLRPTDQADQYFSMLGQLMETAGVTAV